MILPKTATVCNWLPLNMNFNEMTTEGCLRWFLFGKCFREIRFMQISFFMWNTKNGDLMEKRIICVFLSFCIVMGCLCLRLYHVTTQTDAVSYISSHTKKIVLDTLRLPFFDCEGKLLVNENQESFIVSKPTEKAIDYLSENLENEQFEKIYASLSRENPGYVKIGDRYFEKTNDCTVLKKNIRYSDNPSAVHLLGYIDSDGNGVSGLERSFNDFLKTDVDLFAGFLCDARGKLVAGTDIETDISYEQHKGGLHLTIDKDIQGIVGEELRASTVKKGAVLVCDTSTGEIKAMVSMPEYDPDNVGEFLERSDSPLLNRALSAYAVGSVFKVVVAASALEKGVDEEFSYNCNGKITVRNNEFKCNNSTAHGKMNMESALSESCNCYFIALGQKIGSKAILETAKALGFGQNIEIAKGIACDEGIIPDDDDIGTLANLSFGQGKLTATAVQMINVFNCVANGGEYVLPFCVNYATDLSGEKVYEYKPKAPIKALSEETAKKLKQMLTTAVEKGTARSAKSDVFLSAGKTATAQTGIYTADKERLCTWFGGFFPADNPKYCVVIVCEDGTTGGENCAPVFKAVAERIYERKLKNQ